ADFDPAASTVVPPDDDIAGVERRERYVRVYLVRDVDRVVQIVLPVRGDGWSTMRAYVALDRDLATIRGFSVYSHEETAGLGAEVDDPKWKARWPGKRLFDAAGVYRLTLAKGAADPASVYEVDGISGASVTTEGIENLLRFWFGKHGYRRYLTRLAAKGVDHD
ncbi:MAG: FMN-binding protein, partial [Planctomycetota bacterium]|nr:FMN-binding protein [Planctomycetota bacterium]